MKTEENGSNWKPLSSRKVRRLIAPTVLAFVGYWVTYLLSSIAWVDAFDFLADEVPMPYHVPQFKGGLTFRFAMAHDVLHERFAKHGHDYFLQRNELVRTELARLDLGDTARWPLMDDLGAGLDRTGSSAEAVDLLRTKLAEQEQQGLEGRKLYTTFANLGTFLIHASFPKALKQDSEAIEDFREGVAFIAESVRVNPEAHFGREQWQRVVAEFFLAVFESPELLTKYDCIGNRLDVSIALKDKEDYDSSGLDPLGFGRPHNLHFRQQEYCPDFYTNKFAPDDVRSWHLLVDIRRGITDVGGDYHEGRVDGNRVPTYYRSAPFDEPMLGIIGMWREGGGANPHFALAIAETMLRVGQRRIAWTGYERAKLMAERFSPDPELQKFLTKHCNTRQAGIERILGGAAATELKSTFTRELQFGLDYQAEFQAFERSQLSKDPPVPLDVFYNKFTQNREPIASRPGVEETYRILNRSKHAEYVERRSDAYGWLAAGIFGILPCLPWVIRKAIRFVRRTPNSEPHQHPA